ncbi:hypothetical protein DD237_004379 [Peronospora effusa]|uniref:Putative zinc-finger domain-containing protein n=1 Tax=Peronospora effusa TaxID=542832 RepID=A0A425BYZ0_9STRA|nr:hypothetical protein DD237_004379 [Peronospora effusa]
MNAEVSTAEGSMAFMESMTISQRLFKVSEERQRWIDKRDAILVRKHQLLKLLELQTPNVAKDAKIGIQKAQNEESVDNEEINRLAKRDAAALARKKELTKLQARAEAAKEVCDFNPSFSFCDNHESVCYLFFHVLLLYNELQKQQIAATNLKQLQAKRKREEKESDEQPRKLAHMEIPNTVKETDAGLQMHPFATAPDLDVGTAALAEAACVRIATRHLVQTHRMISREELEETFKIYTGKDLDQVGGDRSSLECSLASCYIQEPRRTSLPTTSRRSACWQPGRQFLKTPTFISSDASQIQAMIEVEKEVVAAVCDTLQSSDMRELKSVELVKRCRRATFLENCLAGGATTPTLSAFLCARVGVDWVNPTASYPFRFLDRSYGQMTGVFENMEKWLREQSEPIGPHSGSLLGFSGPDKASGAPVPFLSSKYARPFSIATESIVRQLKGAETVNSTPFKTIDPMKTLCHFELNGACNDQNCSNYHWKDYEPVKRKTDDVNLCSADDSYAKVVKLKNEENQLLLSFAEFRGRIMKKWPVITTSTPLAATEKSASVVTDAVIAGEVDAAMPVAKSMARREGDSGEDDGDYISLDVQEKHPEIGNARYFDNLDSIDGNGDMLQKKVEERPNDTNAWLRLAIYQLGLDVGMSDEAVILSDQDRLQQQLLFLSIQLNSKVHNGASRILNVEEENLKRCLHTLSRALEIEANAYCEALWLLYLHLCKQVTSKQTEIDMVEQAVQFLPSSHALWLRYISTYDFDSMGMAEGIYWRLLEHLARESSAVSTPNSSKKLSALLTAICLHLCMKLWNAGATCRTIEFLSALLQFGDTSLEFGWCTLTRGKLRSEDLIVFHLIFAHVLLFKELPSIIEHWVVASNDARIPVKDMIYNFESLQRGWPDIDVEVCGRALTAYESAFQLFGKEGKDEQDAGNAILNNWMLVLAHHDGALGEEDKNLQVFFEKKLDLIQQYPGASLTAAKLMGRTSTGEKQACQLMLTMINRSSLATFPEAFHHYLFACRLFSSLVDALDKIFPDVLERLASFLDVDINRVKKSIEGIMHSTCNVSKSCALKAVLDNLLAAWIDQLASLRRSNLDQLTSQRPISLADVCVALDICHLMGILLEPSGAIEGIQMVLSSSNFGTLSYEARQLAWMQRFVFQVDLLQQEKLGGQSSREHQTKLTRLFRKYMAEMSVETEMTRQALTYIRYDIARDAVDRAVCACLYPERSHLITFGANLELFQMCANAVAHPEKTTFYAAFTDCLALSPEFSLGFSDIAFHEWELLAARVSLRKCFVGAKTKHSRILQALVAMEMRLRNMKAVSCLLKSEVEADPLRLEPWRLILGLEIIFGETLDVRSKSISEEMEKRQLVLACNTFGDDKILDQKDTSWIGDLKAVSLNLRGLGLKRVPNAVLLKNQLVSLDISGNECTELPTGLRQLQNLQELNASENALIEVPIGVNGLTQLKELRLAHNNITTFPVLPKHLNVLDISWNAILHLPAPALFSRTGLITLRAEENAIPVDELSNISDLLLSRECATFRSLASEGSLDEHIKKREDILTMQKSNANLFDSTTVQRSEISRTVVDLDVVTPTSADAEMTTDNLNTGHSSTAKKGDSDQVVERKGAHVARKSIMHGKDQTTVADLDQVTVLVDTSTLSALKENNSNRVVEELTRNSSMSETTMASKAVEQTRDIIEVDSSELSEDDDEDTIAPGGQAETFDSNTESSADTTNNVIDLSISTINKPTMASIAEAKEVVTAALTRRQPGHEGEIVVRRKLAQYMEHYRIDSRAEVRERNPTLWREFFAATLPVNVELPACRLCFAPNDGHNQRFNSTVLCMRCLDEALIVLKERNGQVVEAQEDV